MNVFTKSRVFDVVVLVLGFAYLALAMVPIGYWYDVGDLVFPEAVEGQPILLEYNGGAKRQFLGSYTVIARDFTSRAVVCDAASGPFRYEVGALRPDPLSMDWWAPSDSRCHHLPAGTYAIETCWEVHAPFGGLVPSKVACVTARLIITKPTE